MKAAAGLIIAAAVAAVAFSAPGNGPEEPARAVPEAAITQPTDPAEAAPPRAPLSEADAAFYRATAQDAWAYMERNYQPTTGFVNATPDWAYTTVWDVGGQLMAFLAAKELGLLEEAEYHRRTARALQTLERAQLFRNAAYNKLYSTKDGSAGDGKSGPTGWSATDLGRMMVGLKVLAEREPRYAEQAKRIVDRIDFRQVVKDGYVHGQLIGRSGQPWTFQEGRIGYEQYVAQGFNAWGQNVRRALDVNANARPVKVMGVELLADTRKLDRLLSEPFILQGVELGLEGDYRRLAENLLRAQEARYRETGQITMASEDAVAVRPSYFYYYCVYCNGKPFVIDISSPGNERNEPRWVSTKAAFGWHALMPSEYTQLALDHVKKARDPQQGWASGVFERTGESTKTWDINTAAVLLEVSAYQLRGRKPLIQS